MRSLVRWSVLLLVACIGLSLTVWVTLELRRSAQAQLEQRFQQAARERAERIVATFEEPLTHFDALQRLFRSVGKIEKPAFEEFVEPLVGRSGVLGFGWAPRVDASERKAFERQASRIWEREFFIADFDDATGALRAPERAQYFPVLFNDVSQRRLRSQGIDLFAPQARRALILRAIGEGRAVSSGVVHSSLNANANGKTVVFVAPVYDSEKRRPEPGERLQRTRGVLVSLFDVDHLLQESNRFPTLSQLRAVLYQAGESSTEIARWEPPGAVVATPL